VTGVRPGQPGWAAGAPRTDGAAAATIGARGPAGAPARGRNGPGRDGGTPGDAAPGSGPRDAGTPAAAPGAAAPAGRGGDGPGAGREPIGLLTGGGPALPARPAAGGKTPPGGIKGPTLNPRVPSTPAGGAPETPSELGEALGPTGGDVPDRGLGGRLPGGDATGGPQDSAPPASPKATVQSASDTLPGTATDANVPDAGLPSRAPEAP